MKRKKGEVEREGEREKKEKEKKVARLHIDQSFASPSWLPLKNQYMFIGLTSVTITHFKVSFYKKYNEEVKQFLTQFFIKRKQKGYMVIKDPRSTFYKALCVGLDGDENLSEGDYMEKTLAPNLGVFKQ
ncbi:uncharacterized protein LOC111316836 [Durio zibethinus]|uniref:Uncharacterized protein LOC111316836 n=1 Tax=Durio zibethinus TaxID=66656 RepID=A0A6P6BCA0_DURZI|nr:uncharacterized protein LOC111316836 [Durio zibethinus]